MMTSMHKLLFLPLAAFLLAVLGCSGREGHALLERAESLLPIRHDSAVVHLDSIAHPARLPEDSRALYGLLRTIVQNRQGKGVKSDSLIRDSYEYYRDASRAGQTSDEALLRRYAQSCYYMALFYKACDSIKLCEDLFNQAAKYSERCEDWHTCYLAHIQLCVTSCWSNPEYAVRQALKALYFYHKIDDDVNNEVLILLNIANMYFTTADTSKALQYYFEAYELAEQNNLPKSRNEVCKGIANTYLFMGENARALAYAQKAATMADSVTSFSLQYTLAECYKACDSLKKAKIDYEVVE